MSHDWLPGTKSMLQEKNRSSLPLPVTLEYINNRPVTSLQTPFLLGGTNRPLSLQITGKRRAIHITLFTGKAVGALSVRTEGTPTFLRQGEMS